MNIASTMLLAAALTGPQPTTTNNSEGALRTKCIISVIHEVNVPAKRNGVLMKLEKHEGDAVEKSTAIANIDDRDALARVRAAELRQKQAQMQAENTQRIKAAKLATKVAEFEHEQSVKINLRSPGTVSEVELKQLDARVQQLDLTAQVEERAVEEAKVLALERGEEIVIATNDLQDREVKSPLSGVIAEVFHDEGEWLQQGEPIMRIMQMDRLKAEAYVSLNDVRPDEIRGRNVVIEVKSRNRKPERFDNCSVQFVSPEVEPGGRYRIWAEVPNRQWPGSNQWILRPGMVAEIVILLDPPSR
jgi:multidrug efflux pump subunit AcrA (membrane-fusion protein)